ncbi:MAG: hypothetical protein ACLU30_02140 [Odoribacter splanchnicus]
MAGRFLLNVIIKAEEGYELDFLRSNEKDVVNHTITLPEEGGDDTIRIMASMKIQTKVLTVVQPAEGEIVVEYWNGNEWQMLDVTQSVELDYWTRLRAKVMLRQPDKYIASGLILNEASRMDEGEEWVVKEDAVLRLKLIPDCIP